MKRLLPFSLIPVCLSACSAPMTLSTSLEEKLQNPIYAEQYFDELVDYLVTLDIQNDPVTKDDVKKQAIDATRLEALRRAKEATQKQSEGQQGVILSDFGTARGEVLLLADTLYLGETTLMTPGPSIHAYLTESVDPREAPFPDASAVDLGPIKDPYGAQSFAVPPRPEGSAAYRTFVLWDSVLERIVGFAQLQGE